MKKPLLIATSILSIAIFVALFASQLIPFLKTGETSPSITNPESSAPESSGPIVRPGYPINLIEGKIAKIEKKESKIEFTIEVKIDKIFLNTTFNTREIIILADQNTETLIYDMETEEEVTMDIESFRIHDDVVISIVESNRDAITATFYTAKRIKKMFSSGQEIITELGSTLDRIEYSFGSLAI